MSADSYYNLTTVRLETVDVAIQRKAKVSTMPDWPVLSIYYYSHVAKCRILFIPDYGRSIPCSICKLYPSVLSV